MCSLHLRRTVMAVGVINITQSQKSNLLQAALSLVAEHTGTPAPLERILFAMGSAVSGKSVRNMLLAIGKFIGQSAKVCFVFWVKFS